MEYGFSKKQGKIVDLGKRNQLRYQDFIDIFGHSQAIKEIDKLEELELILIDEDTLDDTELTLDTKIIWLGL